MAVDLSGVPANFHDVAESMARSRVLREVCDVCGDVVDRSRATSIAGAIAEVREALSAWRGCEFVVAVDDALVEA